MADDKKRVEIDVTPAVQALGRLTQALDRHNEKVSEAKKEVALLTTASRKANVQMREVADAHAMAATQADNFREKMQQANQMLRNNNRMMDTAATRLGNMNLAARYSANSVSILTGRVEKQTDAVRVLNRVTRGETAIRDRNNQSLKEFYVQIRDVTSMMARKNQNINAQARAHVKDTAALRENTKAIQLYGFSLHNIYRIYANFAIFGALFKVSNDLRDSIRAAKDWEQVMSEIITVADGATFTTAHYRRELSSLSNAYGLDTLDIARGAYDALSNQVTDAANATRFMREEVKLSLATVSSMDNAVNATSSAIQAFGYTTGDSSRLNAIYFKTVEEGRVRLDEMANSIGRVSVLSNELNVSFVEQQAAISLLTKKGIEADVAMTLLRNVLLKLAKPTDTMKALFSEVGVTSGQAMIAAYGLGETLRILSEQASGTGDRAAEMAELFGDIRAITGAAALTQGDLNDEMRKFGTSGASYVDAVMERFNALDTRANVQLQRFQNLLVNTFGNWALRNIVNFVEAVGGIEGVSLNAYRAGRDLLILWGSYIAASRIVAIVTNVNVQRFAQVAMQVRNMSQAMRLASFAMTGMKMAMSTLATAGVTLLLMALVELYDYQRTLAINAEITTTRVVNAYDKMSMATNTRLQATIDDATIAFETQIRILMQAWRIYNVDLLRTVTATTKGAEDRYKALGEAIKEALEVPIDGLKDKLKDGLSEIERALSEMEARTAKLDTFKRDEALRRTVTDIESGVKEDDFATQRDALTKLIGLRATLEKQLQEAIKAGNLELYDEIAGRADGLEQDIQSKLEALRNEAGQMEKTVTRQRGWMWDEVRGKWAVGTEKTETESKKDADTEKFALEQLAALEKQRRDFVSERVRLETEHIARQKALAEEEQKRLLAQQEALVAFEKTLAALDSFEPTGDPTKIKEFSELVKRAEAESGAAGIDPAKRLELLRQARAQEIELNRLAVQKMVEEETRIKTEALDRMNEHLLESAKERQQNETEILQQQSEVIRQSVEDAQNVLNITKSVNTWMQHAGVAGNQEQSDELNRRLKKLQEEADDVQQQATVMANTPEKDRARAMMVFQKQLEDYRQALGEVLRMQDSFVTGVGTTPLGQYKLGDEKSLTEALKSANDLADVLDEIQQKRIRADSAEALLNAQLVSLRALLGGLPKAYEQDARAANESMESKIQRNAVYIQQLRETIALLEALRAGHEAALRAAGVPAGPVGPGRAMGGMVGPQHFAMGGMPRGTDVLPAMLSPREMVMNSAATSAYSPLLNALNRMPPTQQSNNSLSIADVHIQMPAGTPFAQARAFWNEIRRQGRLGMLGTRGDTNV